MSEQDATTSSRVPQANPVTDYAMMPAYVKEHIYTDPIGVIENILKYHESHGMDGGTRRHMSIGAVMVGLRYFAARIMELTDKADHLQEQLTGLQAGNQGGKSDLLTTDHGLEAHGAAEVEVLGELPPGVPNEQEAAIQLLQKQVKTLQRKMLSLSPKKSNRKGDKLKGKTRSPAASFLK